MQVAAPNIDRLWQFRLVSSPLSRDQRGCGSLQTALLRKQRFFRTSSIRTPRMQAVGRVICFNHRDTLLNVVGVLVTRAVLALNCFPNRGTLCAGVPMSTVSATKS
jgi:hypothetical protein